MNITETAVDGLKREYLIQIGAAVIDADVQNRLKELSGQIKMPGFRPGKVPLNLITKTHGDAVYGEVVQKTINESLQSALDTRDVRPATEPKVEITKAGKGEDLEFKVAIEVLPEFEPANLSDITLEKLVAPVEDGEVETQLKALADSRKVFTVAEGKAAERGDALTIDFVGRINGELFADGAAEGVHLEIGTGRFIPGFEDQLVGARAGESVQVNVTFPDNYGVKELVSKNAVFDVEVKDVKTSAPVVLDDEFAKGFGMDTMEDLKKALQERIEQEHSQISREYLKRTLLDVLAERHDFPVPLTLVEMELEQIVAKVAEEKGEGQLSQEQLAEVGTEFGPIAERRVRLGLLLAEIGRRNTIQITAQEVNRAIFQEARRWPGQEKQVVEFFQNNPQAQSRIRAPLYEDKVVDFILELTQVSERSVTLEDLRKTQDEAEDAAA